MAYKNSNDDTSLWFLVGLGAGAIVGLLFAPAPGSELRAGALERLAKGRQAVEDAIDDSLSNVRHAVDRQVAIADHTVKEGVAAFQEAREVYSAV